MKKNPQGTAAASPDTASPVIALLLNPNLNQHKSLLREVRAANRAGIKQKLGSLPTEGTGRRQGKARERQLLSPFGDRVLRHETRVRHPRDTN